MNELALLLDAMCRQAKKLDTSEFDARQKEYLLDDIHKLRGRLMAGSANQGWQNVKGAVNVTINKGN